MHANATPKAMTRIFINSVYSRKSNPSHLSSIEFATKKMQHQEEKEEEEIIRSKKVKDILEDGKKRRLVEVPYTASLGQTMNVLVANRVVAVPVAAPPGQWIGAGGSMIMESDKQTGSVRKQYIGMVTMLDILAHIADSDSDSGVADLDRKMSVEVSSIIGHCLEGLSLWTLNPNTGIMDCMEVLSKGIHRALVPIDSQIESVSGVELVESASAYRMLTQMDVLKFLNKRVNSSQLQAIASNSVKDLGAITETVFAVTHRTKLINAIKSMRTAQLNAVPIVTASDILQQDDHQQLINGRGRKVVGTFSSTDLRGCHLSTLQSWLPLSVLQFTETVKTSPLFADSGDGIKRDLVTCRTESSLGVVIDKAVSEHVHRIWVVDQQGLLVGLVSLTDMIRVLRLCLLSY